MLNLPTDWPWHVLLRLLEGVELSKLVASYMISTQWSSTCGPVWGFLEGIPSRHHSFQYVNSSIWDDLGDPHFRNPPFFYGYTASAIFEKMFVLWYPLVN